MIRMSEKYVHNHWITGEKIKLRNRIYRMGKMNYGDYFLEEKRDWNRPKTMNHTDRTLWLKKELRNEKYTGNYVI